MMVIIEAGFCDTYSNDANVASSYQTQALSWASMVSLTTGMIIEIILGNFGEKQ